MNKVSQRIRVILWSLVAICILSVIAGIVTICILHSQKSQLEYSYGIGIDAGSSRTDFYVYRWPTNKNNGTGVPEQIYKCPSGNDKKTQALTSFELNPSSAGSQCIKPCMDKVLPYVPSTDYSTTPVFLGATAGMRILNLTNSLAAEEIMTSVRSTLSSYPFQLSQPQYQVRIIKGSEEGAFGWVTSNYLSGSFGVQTPQLVSSSQKTVGALDMGGASTQITFDPEGHLYSGDGNKVNLQLFGYTYSVYTHSYLCYGFDESNRKYKALLVQINDFSANIEDPCAPSGNETQLSFGSVFKEPCTSPSSLPDNIQMDAIRNRTFVFKGTSDSELCYNLTHRIFNYSAYCSQPPCTFDGVYQPHLSGDFLAFSGFYYALSDLGLDPTSNFSLNDYRYAMNTFCSKSWDEISGSSKSGSILVVLCFQSQLIYHLLVDSYGFNDTTWSTIKFVLKINNNDFGWILGMMLNTTNVIPPHDFVTRISDNVFIALLVIFSCLVLIAVTIALFIVLSVRRNQEQSNL